ncbi:hypothetical protein FJU08_02125 [Martelella alba]|uniref:Uncharacterized protein n=1 Tax=Martelella alba TaxID=2590451 RepID=A0A506UJ81_9HYPH|nr:hypothetical protein [Martelella alba]TPW33377.1 hypothetical protein FJU08_02125 [Martelella alba]
MHKSENPAIIQQNREYREQLFSQIDDLQQDVDEMKAGRLILRRGTDEGFELEDVTQLWIERNTKHIESLRVIIASIENTYDFEAISR